jgi:hypothetical protein
MLDGYKTFLGVVVTLAGAFKVADYFGGQAEFDAFLNAVIVIVGAVITVYGRIKATKIYQ